MDREEGHTGEESHAGTERGDEGESSDGGRSRWEEHRVAGDRVVERIREIIREGNVRRIIIRNDDGKTIVELPLTLGVVGTLLAPAWAAVGAIAALVTRCSIVVERGEDSS